MPIKKQVRFAEKGGKLKVKEIKSLIKNSGYDLKKGINKEPIGNYEIDEDLTNPFVKTYLNPKTGHVVVVHRGSDSSGDVLADARLGLLGSKDHDRFGISKDTQRKAEKKYDPKKMTVLGSSLGGILAEDSAGPDVKEVITFNKAAPPSEIKKKIRKNQYDIRSNKDAVSLLSKTQQYEKPENNVTIKSKTPLYNQVQNHMYPVLDQLDPEMEIGESRTGLRSGKQKRPRVTRQKVMIAVRALKDRITQLQALQNERKTKIAKERVQMQINGCMVVLNQLEALL